MRGEREGDEEGRSTRCRGEESARGMWSTRAAFGPLAKEAIGAGACAT